MTASLDHINIRVPENRVDEALNFYRDTLDLEAWKLEDYRKGDRTSFFFKIGEKALLNIRPVDNFERPQGLNLDHFCIVLDMDVSELRVALEDKGFNIVDEGEPLGVEGRAPALYVEDPFGYVLELKETV